MPKVQIEQTLDYHIFKTLKGNRKPNRRHIEQLKKSMSSNLHYSPIQVNEKMEIIDGQHRFYALKELGLPIDWYMKKGATLNDVRGLNLHNRIWSSYEFLESQISMGNENYIKFERFMKAYGFTFRIALSILTLNNNTKANEESFRRGEFVIKNIKKSEEVASKLISMSTIYSGWNRVSFILALTSIISTKKEFSLDEFINKLKIQPGKIVDCTNISRYKELIEEVYNFKRAGKINLRY